MQDLRWLDHLPTGSLDGGMEMLNRLRWHLRVTEPQRGTWVVSAGECAIFLSDSREGVDAFLYGLALGYACMPEKLQEAFQKYMLSCEGNTEISADCE